MSKRKEYLLRIPSDLWEEIARCAAADLRSVNGEIEFLLREAIMRRRGPPMRGSSRDEGGDASKSGNAGDAGDRSEDVKKEGAGLDDSSGAAPGNE